MTHPPATCVQSARSRESRLPYRVSFHEADTTYRHTLYAAAAVEIKHLVRSALCVVMCRGSWSVVLEWPL
jgi:hypothetical protein